MAKRIFLSYHFPDSPFVSQVYHELDRQDGFEPYFYGHGERGREFPEELSEQISNSDYFVLFKGPKWGHWQIEEARLWMGTGSPGRRTLVEMGANTAGGHIKLNDFMDGLPNTIRIAGRTGDHVIMCAMAICETTGSAWLRPDGLPTGFLYDYEKKIIEDYKLGGSEPGYSKKSGEFPLDKVRRGCPIKWPAVSVRRRDGNATIRNPLPEARDRYKTGLVSVDARLLSGNSAVAGEMVLPEAGPRESLAFPPSNKLRVRILVSGGLAPGINATITGIVARHNKYDAPFTEPGREDHSRQTEILGYQEGFKALTRDGARPPVKIELAVAKQKATDGGSMLTTSREDDLLESSSMARRHALLVRAALHLHGEGVDILYVIGGGGSMRAAHALGNIYDGIYNGETDRPLTIVGVPKTMDNDILWVWQSFGFTSAVEGARDLIMQLHTEVTSNPRLCVVQLFGSDSGFVVSHAALGCGVCDLALIPEMQFSMDNIWQYVRRLLRGRLHDGIPHGIVIMAETALPTDAAKYFDSSVVGLTEREVKAIKEFESNGRRVLGQTPDELRSAALKIVSRELQRRIQAMNEDNGYWKDFRVFVNEPRHLIRSMPPSATEVAFANRLGTLAVDAAMAGFTDAIVSQWLTEFVLVPLKLVVLGKKRVPLGGMFWQSVCASTGQTASAGTEVLGHELEQHQV